MVEKCYTDSLLVTALAAVALCLPGTLPMTLALDHSPAAQSLAAAIAARRTFAIISHPDAGKTTLTEKLLLYGNAIHLAGSVRARRSQRHATSDWMAMERERGISITSTVLQFPYQGRIVNLLDTPGHEDFSEDTYRTLAAVDSAVMVLDAAKGIEAQTRKLFEVTRRAACRCSRFINKLDRPARDPLELLDEIESVLGMQPVPVNWPIGDGPDFRGVYDRAGRGRAPVRPHGAQRDHGARDVYARWTTRRWPEQLDENELGRLRADVELLDGLGIDFDAELVLAGRADAGLFWQRADQLWGAAVPGWFRGTRPAAAALPQRCRANPAGPARLLGLRVQDPGQHEPQPPRQRGLSAGGVGPVRARHVRWRTRKPARPCGCRGRTGSLPMSAR